MKRILRITILLLLFTFLPFKIIGIAKEKDKVNFEEVMDFTAEDGDDKQQLIIPTQEELKACGYPEN